MVSWPYVAAYLDTDGSVVLPKNKTAGSIAFYNVHSESLLKIAEFLSAGAVYSIKHKSQLGTKQNYVLRVWKIEDLRRIVPLLIPHMLIKNEKAELLLSSLIGRKPAVSRGWSKGLSPSYIHKLYWIDGLSLLELGERYGVTLNAIQYFFKKHDIPRRPKSVTRQLPISRERRRISCKARKECVA